MRDFVEVLTDYTDENGNIHIDCYTTSDADEGGVSAGYVTPDGVFVVGNHIEENELTQEIIKQAIRDVKETQLDNKQIVVEKVIEQIKIDFSEGFLEAVEELLRFIPIENLKGFLPEEE